MNRASIVLIAAGALCLMFAIFRISGNAVAAPAMDTVPEFVRTTLPVRITIPARRIDTAVVPGALTDIGWSISKTRANFLVSSAVPGGHGNTVIYGHNTRNVFSKLKTVRTGDSIELSTDAGGTLRYTVVGTFVTDSKDMRFVHREPAPVLTLYTCTGLLDSKRFIVRAVPEKG